MREPAGRYRLNSTVEEWNTVNRTLRATEPGTCVIHGRYRHGDETSDFRFVDTVAANVAYLTDLGYVETERHWGMTRFQRTHLREQGGPEVVVVAYLHHAGRD